MMTQPIRTFKDLTSETAPAGGNDLTKHSLSHQGRRLLEQNARYARAELLANAFGDTVLWLRPPMAPSCCRHQGGLQAARRRGSALPHERP